jgi:hypothetical protein
VADPQVADPLAQYGDTIDAAAHEWRQDPTMLRALILQESGGKPGAVSSAGARGLGQIIPKTAAGLGITDPSDTAQQIFGAAKYLAEGFAKEKTPEGALLYYHGGPDWRKQYGPESAAYVPGVAAHYTRLSKGAGNDNSAPAVPSDEAFLKQAAPSPAAAVPSDEEFLKSTGAAPPQPAETPAPAASNAVLGHLPGASSVTSDAPMPTMPSGLPGDPDETAPAPTGWSAPPIPEPVKRVGGAMADAWNAPNPLMTPELQRMIEAGGVVGRYITSPLLQAGGWAMGGAGALTAGGMAAANEVAGGGPLGRDVAQMLQLMPEVQRTGGLPGQATVPQAGPRNALAGVDRPYLTPEASADIAASRPNMLRADANETSPTGVPQFGGGPQMAERPPSPGMAAPQPQSGAAAPQFLDAKWLHTQGSDAAGRYDMGAGGAAVAGAVEDALKRGDTVTYMADGGRKAVPIVAVKNGLMQDATGQRWGAAQLASDGTGREGVQITPKSGGAAVPAAGEVVDGWRRMTPGEPMVPGQEVATDAHGQQWVRADGAPQPRAAGAAGTPYTQSQMTPDEIIANRHVAEKDWLNRTIQPGVEDNRVLVEGNNPTLAQREQNAATSREQKSLTQQNPQLAQEEQELLDLHDTNRKRIYAQPDLAGSTVLLNNAEKAANDKLKAGLNAAFANKTAADAQPVVTMADKFLSGREGKRAVIETEVRGVRTRLFDDEGNLETDPEILWGVREHINDVLSKENQRQNPVSGRAQSVLIAMRDKLDEVIDPAAPGFRAAIKGYAEEMKAPDVMRALQERENGLYDSKGRMQFSRFHSLMRDIVDARQPGAALSAFQHISDEQMVKLQNLHDDLKRAATAQDLAAARGSDTAQNLWDAARTYAKGRGTAAINMIPYVGGLVRHGQEAYAPYKEMKAQQNALNRGIEMLRPPPDKYPTRNPLGD